MGGGGSSSSSNTTTNTNTSGQNAIQGDNLGVAISGVNDSTVNVNMTDHGAMERAAELGELALNSNTEVSTKAMETNAKVTSDALNMGKDVVKNAMNFGEKALATNADVSKTAMKHVTTAHSENLQHLAGLAGNQAAQNTQNIKALKDLATMKVDGGQVATSKQMTITVGLVMLFLAVIFMQRGK
ncbi:chemotaxis protein [Photobacterium jeanii]|uniref:Chemotaxis protein n=1 Tax=Photobacterium jeanii TaxID=858640 RepID=A0A178K2S3_9GAMM|nr:chemotaxis protein [Photobacterium jeanii]OAN11581.1 chemotaxis protein [Photobacterium jeanii]PST91103.1 chemotaxis protein [Photobacterium jeanii]